MTPGPRGTIARLLAVMDASCRAKMLVLGNKRASLVKRGVLVVMAIVVLCGLPAGAWGADDGAPASVEGGVPPATELRADFVSRPDFVLGHWAAEIPMVSLSAGTLVAGFLQPQVSFSGHPPDNGFHGFDPNADAVSDFTGDVGGALLGIAIGSTFEYAHLRNPDFLYSTLVAAEAWALGAGSTRLLKHSIGRCRPVAWDESTSSCNPNLPTLQQPEELEAFGRDAAFQAMPSGHVAGIAAVSGAYFWMALRSRERAPLRWIAFGVTQSMTWATAGLRIAAGAHSPSDVLVSYGLNSFLGISVAALHGRVERPRKSVVSWQIVPRPGGLGVRGRF